MRDSPTIPYRPLRDLSAEARAAVERSRARRVAAIDKTIYVRTKCATKNRTGVEVTARKPEIRFGQISDNSSASLLWAGVIAALLTWIAALALCLLA